MSDAQGNTVVLDKYGNQAVEPIKHVTREDIELLRSKYMPDRFKFDVALRELLDLEPEEFDTKALPQPAPLPPLPPLPEVKAPETLPKAAAPVIKKPVHHKKHHHLPHKP